MGKLDALLSCLEGGAMDAESKGRKSIEGVAGGLSFDRKEFAGIIEELTAKDGDEELGRFMKNKVPAKKRTEFWGRLSQRVTEVLNTNEVFGEDETLALKDDVEFLCAAVRCVEQAVCSGCKVVPEMKTITFSLSEVGANTDQTPTIG